MKKNEKRKDEEEEEEEKKQSHELNLVDAPQISPCPIHACQPFA